MQQQVIECTLTIWNKNISSNEEIDEDTRQLCDELLAHNALSADLLPTQFHPEGAKGGGIAIGAILLKIAESSGLVAVSKIIDTWLSRDERRSITIELGKNRLEVVGISKDRQQELINWFKTQAGLHL